MTGSEVAAWRVPGRIEVLGKHTDYAGGRVLVCAVERGVTVAAIPGGSGIVARTDAFPGELEVASAAALPPGHWGRYVATVVDRLTVNLGPLAPCSLTISSDLPPASGMSSSSALLCGTALALADLNGFAGSEAWRRACPDRLALAGYLATVENGRSWGDLAGALGVGTLGGSEDHTAMLCGRAGELTLAEFDPLRLLDAVPLASDVTFVVAVSGVLAEKTGAARELYNRASLATASVLTSWNETTGRRDASLAGAARALVGDVAGPVDPHDPALDPLRAAACAGYQADRLDQFLAESLWLVPAAAEALRTGDLAVFGTIADRSQGLAADLLGNQVPETVALAASARALGAHAASAFGAGFGGSVWALVDTSDADAFAARWLAEYRASFPHRTDASVLVSRPGPPAARL